MEIENPEAEQLLYRKDWNDFIIYFLNLNLLEPSSNQKVVGTGRCCEMLFSFFILEFLALLELW